MTSRMASSFARWTLLGSFAACWTLASCSAPPSSAGSRTAPELGQSQAPPQESVPPAAKADPLQPPSGLPAELVTPRQGEALVRAKLSLEQVLASLKRPDWLDSKPKSPVVEDERELEDSVPVAAQRAYAAAREAAKQGRRFEAITQLETAASLAPNRPEIYRRLGMLCIESGNKLRASSYLRKALEINPADAESLTLLGRHELEQNRQELAIVLLAQAMSLKPEQTDPGLAILTSQYLGLALQRDGYDAASIDFLKQAASRLVDAPRRSRLVRELIPLQRRLPALWMVVGDTHMRLDQPALGAAAYKQALELVQRDDMLPSADLVRRVVYAQQRLGKLQEAEAVVVSLVQSSNADDASLELVRHLARQGAGTRQLAQTLRQSYEKMERPGSLAIALSGLLAPPADFELLAAHLRLKPTDQPVVEALISQAMGAGDRPQAASRAVMLTAEIVGSRPELADRYLAALLAPQGAPAKLQRTLDSLQSPAHQAAFLELLRGMVKLRLGKVSEAAPLLAKAFAAEPRYRDIRLKVVKQLLDENQTDAAVALLEPLTDTSPVDEVSLRARLMLSMGKREQAIQLLQDQITRRPDESGLVLVLAGLQLELEDPAAAEQTLQAGLKRNAKAPDLYTLLFRVYDRWPEPDEGRMRSQVLLAQARVNIPEARITKLRQAVQLLTSQNIQQALSLLRPMLADNSKDYEALLLYALSVHMAGNREEAQALIEGRLSEAPGDVEMLDAAEQFYQSVGNARRMIQLREQKLLFTPPSSARDRALAALYLSTQRAPKAVEAMLAAVRQPLNKPDRIVLDLGRILIRADAADQVDAEVEALIKRYPQWKAELTWEWSWVCEMRGQSQRAEQMLADNVKQFPGHADSNNGLAYTWANRDKNLEEALRLSQAAVAAEPRNSAYRDTLGWVYYKLGRMDEAVDELRASLNDDQQHPVMLDHLGDALWRKNRTEEARQVWTQAEGQLRRMVQSGLDVAADPDMKSLPESLRAKLQAVEQNKRPPVSRVPSLDDARPADGNAGVQPAPADEQKAQRSVP